MLLTLLNDALCPHLRARLWMKRQRELSLLNLMRHLHTFAASWMQAICPSEFVWRRVLTRVCATAARLTAHASRTRQTPAQILHDRLRKQHASVVLAEAVQASLHAYAIMRGWAIAVQEHSPEGLVQIRQGLDTYRSTGAEWQRSNYLTLLAEASGLLGQPEGGLAALEEALTMIEQTGERYYDAELHRQRGELLLLHAAKSHPAQGSGDQHEAETCFQHALDVARQQQAKSLELRAAMSLARLWPRQGKRQEAYDLLTPIYGWFTEGFDTADLQEAKTLLDELNRNT